jgi:hypothetical protein
MEYSHLRSLRFQNSTNIVIQEQVTYTTQIENFYVATQEHSKQIHRPSPLEVHIYYPFVQYLKTNH